VQSFNGKLRVELLNRKLLLNLLEARYLLDEWGEEYNERWPHSGLSDQTPGAYATWLTGPSIGVETPPCGQSGRGLRQQTSHDDCHRNRERIITGPRE
jgi:Integrase core domain